ncbi:TRAP transporter substrate-binding protein [Ponticaulis sp.]|uniref:TRAP transporter substrate-binding protein n=1 Tax=Ponticaulis sp. TaxID=2020902 RepID=UPI000B7069D8|nr:TRAP transporter substrate-binding protein [Ponticaulis sp.]MAI89658.1 ABC transporter substrate-binding protein [Ponticaulis sp.]OUY00678.1 MAG: ABC transporter substrate-binding protein [Hyphomonadaceae bacterium TMED5]|tara:strand:- start:132796 stop:133917 length:1122 start_codon:yes stop_codon:yes gene_type:complete
MINRRNLIGAGLLGVGGGVAAFANPEQAANLAAPAISRNRRRLNLVTTWPPGLPGLGTAAERVAERIQTASEGLIEVNVYAAGEFVPAFEAFDAVANGSADMYHGSEYYWTSKSTAYPFFTTVPFGMTAQEMMGWIDFGGGQELWDELSAGYGVKGIQATNTGHQMGGWFRREINSLDDLVGLRMRIPGQGGDVLRAIGGSAVALPGGEIYQALQTGNIDATEWVGPWNDYSLGFFREAPYYYGPGFHEPGAMCCVGVNLNVWQSFNSGEQMMIKSICESVNHSTLGEFNYQNAIYLDKLIQEEGVQLRSFPDDVVTAMYEAARDVRAASGRDGLERRIYESFEDNLRRMRNWANVSDGPYYSARQLGADAQG